MSAAMFLPLAIFASLLRDVTYEGKKCGESAWYVV